MTETVAETLYCANHPQTPTSLRCNKCGKPICARCAVRTPVGYRCKDCVRGQQQLFETALWYDYVVAAIIAAPLAAIAGFLVMSLGFFVFFLSPVVGGAVAELVRAAVGVTSASLPRARSCWAARRCWPCSCYPGVWAWGCSGRSSIPSSPSAPSTRAYGGFRSIDKVPSVPIVS